MTPLEKLRHHVSGAIARGTAEPIAERPTLATAVERAGRADDAWQAGIVAARLPSRWVAAARGAEGSELRRLYDAKVAADRDMSLAFAMQRRAES